RKQAEVPGVEAADGEPDVLQVPAMRGAGVARHLLEQNETCDRKREPPPEPVPLDRTRESSRGADQRAEHDEDDEDGNRALCAADRTTGLPGPAQAARQDERPREIAQILGCDHPSEGEGRAGSL